MQASIAVKLQPEAFPSSEVLYTQGEHARSLMIVVKGIVQCSDPVFGGTRLHNNHCVFGAEIFMMVKRRLATACSLTYVDLFCLQGE
jgi:hypothetical protein